jgi:predicted GNAT family acetyltransferase
MTERDTGERNLSEYQATVLDRNDVLSLTTILSLTTQEFADTYPPADFFRELTDGSSITALLSHKEKLVGFSLAKVSAYTPDTAYISLTLIDPKHRRKGAVGVLMAGMEAELVERGIQYMTRDALVENGYADSIRRHYGDRITEEHPSGFYSRMKPKRFFKIRL